MGSEAALKLPERVRVEPGHQIFLVYFEQKTKSLAMIVSNLLSPFLFSLPFLLVSDPKGLSRGERIHGERGSSSSLYGVWGLRPSGVVQEVRRLCPLKLTAF